MSAIFLQRFLAICAILLLCLSSTTLALEVDPLISDLTADNYSHAPTKDKTKQTCPEGTTICKNGDSVACCLPGSSGKTYSSLWQNSAWCSPDNEDSCPDDRPEFCSGSKDNACCKSSDQCVKRDGYAWCSVDKTTCEDNGGSPCGTKPPFQCCSSNQSCKSLGWGYYACDSNSCPAGQELCQGRSYSICCNKGQCNPSSTGAAHCKDGLYNPESANFGQNCKPAGPFGPEASGEDQMSSLRALERFLKGQ